ncbi:MAG: hypothetical protein CL780_06870 [Chloroflexi bacterium]|nr:hypothetical protein [Chloroflexota bacterium]
MKIWIDIKMPHEPLFFSSIIENYDNFTYQITSRDFAEIKSLLEKYNLPFDIIGNRPTGLSAKRKLLFLHRVLRLFVHVKNYDISMSHSSPWAVYTSLLRRKKSIVFYDNETNPINRNVFRFTSFLFTPEAIPKNVLEDLSGRKTKIIQFNGYKEDIYIADYKPDKAFLSKLPFEDFVTIRPENLDVLYLKYSQRKTIVPEIIRKLSENSINILYLPRTDFERSLADGFDNVFMPEEALNGLDICYYSSAVLSGSGTIGREASRLGTPAVSFFPGNLLAVDRKLIKDKALYYSRDPSKIIKFINQSGARDRNTNQSKKVKEEVMHKLDAILETIK